LLGAGTFVIDSQSGPPIVLFHIEGEINLKEVACFIAPQKRQTRDHKNHAFHHNITTKAPHSKPTFPKTPFKKHSKTTPPHPKSIPEKKYQNSDIK
jgi:hypothetical protein